MAAIDPPNINDLYKCIEENETVWKYLNPFLPYYPLTSTDLFTNLLTEKVSNQTVLHLALRLDKFDIVMELTTIIEALPRQSQLDICNSQCEEGMAPAHLACLTLQDSVPIVSKLKELGANFNMVDNHGNSPLHYACRFESEALDENFQIIFEQVINVLVHSGATNVANHDGITPLHVVCSHSCDEGITRVILQIPNINLNVVDTSNNTPLHLACSNDKGNKVAVMLTDDLRTDVRGRNNKGDTPLHYAALRGHLCVEDLLKAGAAASVKNLDGEYPLHCACRSQSTKKQVVKWLMEVYPAAVREGDHNGKSPLIVACENYYCTFDVMEELFQHEILPHTGEAGVDHEGRRPIYCLCNTYPFIEYNSLLLLLKRGNDANGCFGNETASTVELICDREMRGAIEVIICFLIDSSVAERRWSFPATLKLPDTCDARLLQQFICDLDVLQSVNKKTDGSKRSNFNELFTAMISASMVGCADFLKKHMTDPNVDRALFNYTNLSKLWQVSIKHQHEGILATLLEAGHWWIAVASLARKGTWLLITKFPHLALKVFDRCVATNDKKELELCMLLLGTTDFMYADDTPGLHDDTELICEQNESDIIPADALASTLGKKEYKQDSKNVHKEIDNIPIPLKLDAGHHPFEAAVAPLPLSVDPLDDHPILLMIKSDHNNKGKEEKLIDHPLVRIFVLSRWCTYGRLLNIILFVVFYGIYLGVLTALFLLQEFPLSDQLNPTEPVNRTAIAADLYVDSNHRGIPVAAILVSWSVLNIVKETLELCQKGKRYRSGENAIEIVLYVMSLIFAVFYLVPNSHRSRRLELWQWRLSGLTVFFGWINLTLFLRKTPFGITVIAFEKIFITFLKHFPIIIIFTFAFSACFYGFLHSSLFFRYFKPLLKVAILIVGDYPTLDHIMGIDGIKDSALGDFDSGLGALIVVIFLCVMTIVMMDMLVGIAVDEISKVLKDSEISSLAMKAEWLVGIRRFEQKGPRPLRRLLTWYIEKCYKVPDRHHMIYTIVTKKHQNWIAKWLNSDLTKAEERAKSVWDRCHTAKPHDSVMAELSDTKQLVMSLPREIDNLKTIVDVMEKNLQQQQQNQLKQLQERLQQQQSLLEQILEKLPKKECPKCTMSNLHP